MKTQAGDVHPLMRIPVPWVFILTYLVGVVVQLYAPIAITSQRAALAARTGGFVLLGIGVLIAFSGLGIFRKRHTTTIPFETPTVLVTSGPYRFTRNPMYVGLTLIYIGVAGTRLEIGPLIVLPLLLAYVSFEVVPVEERHLRDVFGDSYREYSARVRRWL